MSVSDTTKEVVRIASTAGLAKDVIDLMEKKLAILTSELDTATDKFALVEKRVSELESQRTVVFSRIVPAPWVNTKRMSPAPIKPSFMSLAIAALVSGFVVAYGQSGLCAARKIQRCLDSARHDNPCKAVWVRAPPPVDRLTISLASGN
jgi:hypothetical protein